MFFPAQKVPKSTAVGSSSQTPSKDLTALPDYRPAIGLGKGPFKNGKKEEHKIKEVGERKGQGNLLYRLKGEKLTPLNYSVHRDDGTGRRLLFVFTGTSQTAHERRCR